jgi:hypothetical protein
MADYKAFLTVRPIGDTPFTFVDEYVNLYWRFQADGIHKAIMDFLHRTKPIYRRQFASLQDRSSLAFGVLFHNYLVKMDPSGSEYPKLQTMHELLLTYSENVASKIFNQTAGLAAELFGYYAAFDSKEADDLADVIVGAGDTPNGKLLIQALIAPNQNAPSANHRACLYTKLYEAIGRKGDVAEWLTANVPQRHMRAAVSATGWAELLPIMNNKAKGNALEDSLGL